MATSTEDKLVRVSIGGRVRRSIFKIHSTRTRRSRTVDTAVIPLTMVVAAAKSLKEPPAPPPTYGPSLLHCKSRQQPRITNRCHAKPPTRTTYGTTRPYQTLHRSHQLTNGVSHQLTNGVSHQLTNGVSLHNTSGDTANLLLQMELAALTCTCTKGSHTCPLPALPSPHCKWPYIYM